MCICIQWNNSCQFLLTTIICINIHWCQTKKAVFWNTFLNTILNTKGRSVEKIHFGTCRIKSLYVNVVRTCQSELHALCHHTTTRKDSVAIAKSRSGNYTPYLYLTRQSWRKCIHFSFNGHDYYIIQIRSTYIFSRFANPFTPQRRILVLVPSPKWLHDTDETWRRFPMIHEVGRVLTNDAVHTHKMHAHTCSTCSKVTMNTCGMPSLYCTWISSHIAG
jgi:hypothetical protein